jgi:ABC-type amino acid transport substrate-binding protein
MTDTERTREGRADMRRLASDGGYSHGIRLAALGAAVLAATLLAAGPASAATLEQVKQAGKLMLGYRSDAKPFSYRDSAGKPAGYTVALCQKIADQVKTELGASSLAVEWVPVTLADRFKDLQQGKVDLLCGADSVTLARRKEVSFSIPIFPSGIGAMMRTDAPGPLRAILADAPPPSHPVWRGSPALTFLGKKTLSAIKGTTGESWLAGRLKDLNIAAEVVPVDSYEAGIQRVLNGSSDVFFADRAILLDAAQRSSSEDVLDRLFTYEPLAIGVRRGDDDFRLLVDQTLSRLYRSPELAKLYAPWFGKADDGTITFFRLSALPD